MAKTQTHYVCQNCGYSTPKWLGKCPECGRWDTLVEETAAPAPSRQRPSYLAVTEAPTPKTLKQVDRVKVQRMTTGIHEFDRVLGGGIVPGSLILLGGAPGIGKSTITLDVSMKAAARGARVLYVSGEESEAQTAMRAERLGQATDALQIMTATELGTILVQARQVKPRLLVIDSIQTMYNQELESAAGSVGQVRECTAKLLTFAKETGIAIIIIGHVTKEGNIAGPRLLEHMVDVVLQFEGDRSYTYRVLRALKNRFGSTSECGIFSMEEEGLREVANPSGLFLEAKEEAVSGSVITAAMEGNRPILTEIQTLVSHTPFGLPRRTVVGVDFNRVNMLLAVLEKRCGMNFGDQDAYVCAVGGMKVKEPAADLAILGALVSSYRNRPVPMGVLAMGEVGLTGELRRVGLTDRRIKEAAQLGFKRFIVPKGSFPQGKEPKGVTVIQARTVEEAIAGMYRE
ncbi:MAG: DNA repair protein RadA [Acidaminococcus fermentans]|uniref:DNA repair protein RadA n=1 Tax=Acidaminococcus fermentans TaxID=905 RepID=UPI0024316E1A|nr:DNA repair protein RadA [Acidaminococcus fermentans]MCI7194661.1 DNA repair protein RadA [Acidaminococcus fermentans]